MIKGHVVEFLGDPMVALEKCDLNSIFFMNQSAYDEIASYSSVVGDGDFPDFFKTNKSDVIFFAEGGIDEEGKSFPDTYIGVCNTADSDYPFRLSAIYASDFQYVCPQNGNVICLKRKTMLK